MIGTQNMAVLVSESRARCGLPAKITDPATLRVVAGLFAASIDAATICKAKSRTGHRDPAAA